MNEPYVPTLGGLIALIVWLLALTTLTLALWFHRGTDTKTQTGNTTPTRNAPAKPPQRPQEPRKPPPGSPSDPHAHDEGLTAALSGSGPLPLTRDLNTRPPPPTPKQWVETHTEPATTDMRAVQPETSPAPATEQIRPGRKPSGQWGEDEHGNWTYKPGGTTR